MNKITFQHYFIILLLSAVLIVNYFLRQDVDDAVIRVEYSECRLGDENCKIIVAGHRLELFIEGEVKALKPFVVHIVDKDNVIEQAKVRFEMKAMDMGLNQYVFKKHDDGWQANVVIPICTTGRRDWLVELDININAGLKRIVFNIEI